MEAVQGKDFRASGLGQPEKLESLYSWLTNDVVRHDLFAKIITLKLKPAGVYLLIACGGVAVSLTVQLSMTWNNTLISGAKLDSIWGRDIVWFNKIYSEVSNKFAGQPYSFWEIYPTYTFFTYPTTNSESTNPEYVLRNFTSNCSENKKKQNKQQINKTVNRENSNL